MNTEYVLLIVMWGIGIISFFILTPKHKHRNLMFGFLICKTLTWLSTLFHVKFNLLTFPFRELPKATDLLLTTEYFFYPLICGFYIIYEPKLKHMGRFLYLSLWISGLVVIDVMLEKYTNLIEYIHYDWYWTWLTFFCIFALSNMVYQWFFKEKALFQDDKRVAQ